MVFPRAKRRLLFPDPFPQSLQALPTLPTFRLTGGCSPLAWAAIRIKNTPVLDLKSASVLSSPAGRACGLNSLPFCATAVIHYHHFGSRTTRDPTNRCLVHSPRLHFTWWAFKVTIDGQGSTRIRAVRSIVCCDIHHARPAFLEHLEQQHTAVGLRFDAVVCALIGVSARTSAIQPVHSRAPTSRCSRNNGTTNKSLDIAS